MRHRVQKRKFNRDTNHRQALLKNLVRQLVEHGSITTSEAKAKETKRVADKLIGKAQTDNLTTRRKLHTFFGKRDVVNTLIERVAPVFTKRKSGFTRIVKVGNRRGDNSPVVKLELVEKPELLHTLRNPEEPKEKAVAKKVTKTTKAKAAPKATKPAKTTKKKAA